MIMALSRPIVRPLCLMGKSLSITLSITHKMHNVDKSSSVNMEVRPAHIVSRRTRGTQTRRSWKGSDSSQHHNTSTDDRVYL